MYSGGESTDSQKYTQWALNPAAYQNTPNDQVDWAALAQQWIIMKEAGPPPIPGETRVHLPPQNQISHFPAKVPVQPQRPKNEVEPAEGGEAEMDMDTEKDDAPSWSGSEETPPAPGAEAWNNWNPGAGPPGPNWNWSSSWNPPTNIAPPLLTNTKTPLLPTPNRVFPDSASDNATPYTGKYYVCLRVVTFSYIISTKNKVFQVYLIQVKKILWILIEVLVQTYVKSFFFHLKNVKKV